MALIRDFVADERGSMAVELALLTPLALAVLVLVVDMMVFIGDCARFDRLAGELLRSEICSPAAQDYGRERSAELAQEILEAMGERAAARMEIVLSCDGGQFAGDGAFEYAYWLQTWDCCMVYHPWPFDLSLLDFEAISIEHHRSYVLDSYRPGVLL